MSGFRLRERTAILVIAGVVGPIVLLTGLIGFAAGIDDQARSREERIVEHGFATHLADDAHTAVGQSIWDESARHLQHLDLDWARFNVRDFFLQSSGFEYAGVVAPDDSVSYAAHDGKENADRDRVFDSAITPLVAKVRAREAELGPLADRVKSGDVLRHPVQEGNLVKVAGRTYALTATLVQPDATASLIAGRAPIMITGDEIDAAFLADMSDKFMLGQAQVVAQGADVSGPARATFSDADGRPVLTLAWAPQTPGRDLLGTALPLLLVVVCALGGATWFFQRRANRAVEQLVVSEKRASHLAYHDTLTGLANRALTADRLAMAVEQARREKTSFAVHCLDLDRFKDVNDTFGHHIGDELIRIVAQRLIAACRSADTVARLGGDEFAVIQTNTTPEKAAILAGRLVELMAEPADLSIGRVHFGCSIGISLTTSSEGRDPLDCMREADLALYRAKENGRNRFCFFEPDMDAAIRNRRSLQDDLRIAIERDELSMVYQPQVDGRNRVVGVEALMRWNHPTRGAVSPGVFIPLAEECGLIEQLGWFAMRRAFADGRRWPDLKVAVNVSATQLRIKGFMDEVERLAEEYAIDPRRYEIEITEGLLLADNQETHDVLKRIRDLGFSLALDDFGTGYSSLSYLKRFPITRIKIDRSFISNLGVDDEAGDVISAIVRLARALKMAVVAEGVETDEQRQLLTAAGCRDIQGYLASRPLAVDSVQSFIESARDMPASSASQAA